MLFPSIQFIITGLQFQMSINTQSTNTQIQFVTKCQKDQTYALFLLPGCQKLCAQMFDSEIQE